MKTVSITKNISRSCLPMLREKITHRADFIHFSISGTVCPPLNRPGYWVENAVIVSAQSVGYNSRVTWTCHDGYIFADGTFSKTITCQADRTWSEIPDQCISESYDSK